MNSNAKGCGNIFPLRNRESRDHSRYYFAVVESVRRVIKLINAVLNSAMIFNE
jgi:hypothetical protein